MPTSYYAAVQAIGTVTVLDDPAEIAAVLRRQMERMQPEGGYAAIQPGPTPIGRMLPAIRGIRLAISDIRAKFKFGGNKGYEHLEAIAASLAERRGDGDMSAREHLLRRRTEARDR